MIAEITPHTTPPPATLSVDGAVLIAAMNVNDLTLLEYIRNIFKSEPVAAVINEFNTPYPDDYDGTANAPGTVLIWHVGQEKTYRIGFLNIFGETATYFSIKNHRSGQLKSLFPVRSYEVAALLKRLAHDLKEFYEENGEEKN